MAIEMYPWDKNTKEALKRKGFSMEKLNISQICILCTKNIADGRIGKFFAERGVIMTHAGVSIGGYYFSDGRTIIVSRFKPEFRQLINPWKKPYRKFPREMMVSDDGINWYKRLCVGTINHKFKYFCEQFSDPDSVPIGWKYAKEI